MILRGMRRHITSKTIPWSMIVGVAPLQPSDPLHVSMHPWTDLILPPFSELSLPASTKIPQTVSSLESKPQLRATRVSPVSTERCNLECCLPSQLHKLYTVIMRCDPKIHIQVSWNMVLIHLTRWETHQMDLRRRNGHIQPSSASTA